MRFDERTLRYSTRFRLIAYNLHTPSGSEYSNPLNKHQVRTGDTETLRCSSYHLHGSDAPVVAVVAPSQARHHCSSWFKPDLGRSFIK